MDTVSLPIRVRHLAGSDIAKKIRRAGLLPAVLYGNGIETRSIAVDPKIVKRGLTGPYGRNQLFALEIPGEGEQLAIAKEVQVDPLSRALRHVDLFRVQADSKIIVTLPITLTGRSLGQKAGGRLEFITRQVKVSCTPQTLPKVVDIDVTPFDNGTAMMVEELPLPEGVTAVFKRSFKIFEVVMNKAEVTPVEEKKPAGKK